MNIYEVIRVIDSKPLFLEEHLKRMEGSLSFYDHKKTLEREWILKEVKASIEKAKRENFNLRINLDIEKNHYTVETLYPQYLDKKVYKEGVKVFPAELYRKDPHVKRDQLKLREKVEEIKEEKQVYEVLYTQNGKVMEGSKTNVFFIKEGKIYTARDEDVLQGITRQMVLKILEKLKIPLVKRQMEVRELETFEACFLTGTSIHVLPVKSIDNVQYQVEHPMLVTVMSEFEKWVEEQL